MNGSEILLHLAGAVALLLWATRMVRTGVERAYGERMRQSLRGVLHNPALAVLWGLMLSIALQSSTAVSLLVGSFVGSGIVSGIAGLMAVRGAEVGSALVVKILSFDLTLLVPLCLVAGTAIFMSTERSNWRQAGRILVGTGLLILSLEMTGQATEPLRNSELLPVIVGYLDTDPVTAFLLAAVMTWLFHSSIAAVLLLVTFASRGLIQPELGIVMIFGVNLGSSFIAPILTRNAAQQTRIVPMGNLLMRGAGSVVILILYLTFKPSLAFLGAAPADQVINGHILFNILILIAGVPLSGLVLKVTKAIVALNTPAQQPTSLDHEELSALDETVLDTPSLALANATRETVAVCETVEIMLRRIIELYERPEQDRIDELSALDDKVDRKHAAIKLYLAKLTTRSLTSFEVARARELLGACVKLEQVGDIIVRNMLALVQKKMDRNLQFTDEGWLELSNFHAKVLTNARMAFNVLVSRDRETAHQLVLEKDHLRDLESQSSDRHFSRLREGTTRSLETSSIHLNTIRDLKQVNSLLAAVAYPVLEEQGLLNTTRLRTLHS